MNKLSWEEFEEILDRFNPEIISEDENFIKLKFEKLNDLSDNQNKTQEVEKNGA